MARAGQLVAETIALLGEHLQPGITTIELDRIAEEFIRERGGVPTSKGYRGYPAATCISPNSMVVHGIPGEHRVEDGDLISVDVGITLDGLVTDSAYTYAVGEIDAELQRLLDVGKEALLAGIDQARTGNRVGDISHAVQQVVEGAGFSVVRSLVGHGVGRSYHEEPQIPNFGEPGRGPLLQSGMTLAIVQAPYIPRVVGYGSADIEHGFLASPKTLWNVGQITHGFTAVAVMQLSEAGKLFIDDPVGKHVKHLPEAWRSITIRQLIGHSSGLPDYTRQPSFDSTRVYRPEEVIAKRAE